MPRHGCRVKRRELREFLLSAVDRPRDTETVHDRAEPLRPECLLQGMGDVSAVGELPEDALGRAHIVEIELQLKTLRVFVLQDVAAGDRSAADGERGVQDLVAPLRRRLAGRR